ncbi:MAG: adenylate/guanylate cyclase domain-containing protein [Pseudomonadota bacterium]
MTRFHLSTVLSFVLGTMIVASTGAVFGVAIFTTIENTRTALAETVKAMLNDAVCEVRDHFVPMESLGRLVAAQIVDGDLPLDNPDRLRLLLSGAVGNLPQIDAVTIQYRDGSGLYYDRTDDRVVDVVWREEWLAPLDRLKPEGLWVIRPSALTGQTTSAFITPARRDGQDIAIVEIRSDVRSLSRDLSEGAAYRGYPLTRFLILNKQRVLAHSTRANAPAGPPVALAEIDDIFLREVYTGTRLEPNLIGPVDDAEVFMLVTADNQERVMVLMEDRVRQSGAMVTIGVHVDPRAGEKDVAPLINLVWIGLGLLVFFIVVAIYVGRRAAQPIRRFSTAAGLVQQERLDDVPVLPPHPILELDRAAAAFNAMVDGLKERRRIRDLFGKYVPESVAHLLTGSDDVARPASTTGTVLFLDIVGFTKFAESRDPQVVVGTLNAFFSDIVALIEEQQGMITQFQGDAILAVFNVPIPAEDHATRAVRAARDILATVEEREYGGQKLSCRIGINTGPLVAGAIGAEGRLSYTVYGDAVNVSARLEQANKETGTKVLIAEATAELASGFSLEDKGCLPIRGRSEPVGIFTLKSMDDPDR